MKQLKALEILKLNIIVQVLNEENRVKIKEAIKELEELQNRSCSNCKHFIIFNSKVVRDRCNILNVSNIGGCGDYWEQK